MLGRTAIIAGAVFLLLAGTVPVVAGENIELNDQYTMADRNIIVRLIELNISDSPMGNIYAPDYPNTMWVRLVYTFENTGDTKDKGYIQPIYVDTEGNVYQNFNDYTGENVLPHSTAGPFFVEVPFPKNTRLDKVICSEGFTQHEFNIPAASSSPTPGPSASPTATSIPGPGGVRWADCLPLIPFAMAGGVAGVGIVINRSGVLKR
jgi:hypothetical protein